MTMLDTLARSAADAVHESVATTPIPPAPVTAAPVIGAATAVRYALTGAAAAVAVIAAVVVIGPTNRETTTNTTATTSTAAVPTTEASVTTVDLPVTPTTAVEPAPGDGRVAPPVVSNDGAVGAQPDTEPPILVVTSPADGSTVESKIVRFAGTTEAGASVLASGKFAVAVAGDGTWVVDLVVAPGANGVVFDATDDAGNTTRVRMTVYYETPTTTTAETTTTKAAWEFTANQKFGSCSEPVPYDVYSGTAKPGTTVTVSSAYGGGSATANAEGVWSLRVEFPSAPINEPFVVTAKDAFGSKRSFEFVRLPSG